LKTLNDREVPDDFIRQPSTKYSLSGSALRFFKGSTAMTGRSVELTAATAASDALESAIGWPRIHQAIHTTRTITAAAPAVGANDASLGRGLRVA